MELDSLRQEIDALGDAPWTALPHAYGNARDTPGHLAALLGDDEDAQGEAAEHFASAIVHQSTLWPASPDAFEWLVRVLRARPLPAPVLEECLDAVAEAADYLGDVPTGTPVPELSGAAREWLARFADATEDDHESLWEEFLADETNAGVNAEVYNWVVARMAALRPAVLALADELADQAPAAVADIRAAWA